MMSATSIQPSSCGVSWVARPPSSATSSRSGDSTMGALRMCAVASVLSASPTVWLCSSSAIFWPGGRQRVRVLRECEVWGGAAAAGQSAADDAPPPPPARAKTWADDVVERRALKQATRLVYLAHFRVHGGGSRMKTSGLGLAATAGQTRRSAVLGS